MRVILYELNEVPWRVVDDYVHAHPSSNLSSALRTGACFTTKAPDAGELSPWITWPTVHRGVPNTEHKIEFLGQDPKTFRFDPIWTILKGAGHSIGVFGSLQSWPVPPLGSRDFYIPDTFARDAACHPPELSAFQAFNLENVRENGRIVRSRPSVRQATTIAYRLWRLGLRMSTIASAAGQLVKERFERRYSYRRAVYQSKLGFDLYERLWREHKPDFSTYFTNHVAGLQHRYWQASYPDDYQPDDVRLDPFFAQAIEYGMSVADEQIGRLMRLADAEGAVLVVASSMGQEAVHKKWSDVPPELVWRDVDRLARLVRLEGTFSRNLAMEPQVALDFRDETNLGAFEQALAKFEDEEGERVFTTSRAGLALSVTTRSLPNVIRSKHVVWRSPDGVRRLSLDDSGLEIIQPDSPGTAYHMPEGVLIVRGKGLSGSTSRTDVSTLDVVPTILDLFAQPKPAYLRGTSLARELGVVPGSRTHEREMAAGGPTSATKTPTPTLARP